jgi:hypothetical protein
LGLIPLTYLQVLVVVKFKKNRNRIAGVRGGDDNDEDGDVYLYYEGTNTGIGQLNSSVT